ncbi:hypothetical protein TNIN_419281 [Trichonephila inaurata madagascariensis]|uniref:Uncharacterized protein n=1 Tax=Trichonephila inaurata madagascariensis TaxID=2747483 RepID=A0A8X6XD48_9ARAC|nr:hypothetical protein TNIN_146861 [Trichonephila inaurata madagascariensis]GFY63433.1 hypothetical protein TNIN_419281 [Trichonephila inaurata madagascariensis]
MAFPYQISKTLTAMALSLFKYWSSQHERDCKEWLPTHGPIVVTSTYPTSFLVSRPQFPNHLCKIELEVISVDPDYSRVNLAFSFGIYC